jgi:hypothetical protein
MPLPPETMFWNMFSTEKHDRCVHHHLIQIEMFTSEPAVKVVANVTHDEALATHWAWFQDGTISMLQPTLDMLNMCFPYDPTPREDASHGLRIPLIVTRKEW